MGNENKCPAVPVREDPGPVKIGTLCSDCTNPEEKVMQSYVFDLGNIIRLGMYEKARISAEVLCEQGGDPADIARKTVFPAVRVVLEQHAEGVVNRARAMKSLEAAVVAIDVLKREMKDFGTVLQPGVSVVSFGKEDSWETRLMKASLECCGFLPQGIDSLSDTDFVGATSPEGGGKVIDLTLPPGEPAANEESRLRGAREGQIRLLFVPVTPDNLLQVREELAALSTEKAGGRIALFGRYMKIIENSKIDADLYCTSPLFGGKIAFEQLSKKG